VKGCWLDGEGRTEVGWIEEGKRMLIGWGRVKGGWLDGGGRTEVGWMGEGKGTLVVIL